MPPDYEKTPISALRKMGYSCGCEEDSEAEISLADIEAAGMTSARELWSGREMSVTDRISVKLPKHGAKAYRLI